MTPSIAIIGGTSLIKSPFFTSLQPKTVATDHGSVILYEGDFEGHKLAFLQRHHADADKGAAVYNPPHLINHCANLAALKNEGFTHVIAICSVGSLSPSIPISTLVIPDDFYIHSSAAPPSFFPDARGHIVPCLSPTLAPLLATTIAASFPALPLRAADATYVNTVGPRFETPAEVRVLKGCGEVVGMTAGVEAVLGREIGLEYAMVCMVDNFANGLVKGGKLLTEEEFKGNVARNQETVEGVVMCLLRELRGKI
eukprot:CAMPEP_0174887438 /NCGR_PEP_ID=MMETSP0167-20121228/2675_1 /TAXON_ID=38298 /ORGANISM="Rhodella maculata, Strain CCMP736" /LENGTH=254 /DNA_ID=CAMNT_0016123901 /DNA_START=44 /DNA_END=808 /DNA_ORIENTATION=-